MSDDPKNIISPPQQRVKIADKAGNLERYWYTFFRDLYVLAKRTILYANTINFNGVTVTTGAGSPEGVLTAAVSSMYLRTDGGAGTCLYIKESGTGNTGWIAK